MQIEDAAGNIVPDANNQVQFKIEGAGIIAGVDNGHQTSLESFKASYRKAFNGLALAVLQSNGKKGAIKLTATSPGLQQATVTIQAN